MPCSTVTAKQDDIIRIFLGQLLQKDTHADSIAIRHNQKMSVTCQRLHRSVSITVLSDMMAGHTGTDSLLAPAIFRLVDPAKSCFVLEHKTDVLAAVDNGKILYCSVNFFEAAISSSLAFLGCLLRGITLRHPCR